MPWRFFRNGFREKHHQVPVEWIRWSCPRGRPASARTDSRKSRDRRRSGVRLVSAALDIADDTPAPPPPIRAASLADINEMGDWLFPRLCEAWQTSDHQVIAFLRGALPSNEQRLMVCGDAIGMVHIEPGRMGRQVRAVVDFVLSKRLTDGVEECVEIYAWMAEWGKRLGAAGLFRVDDLTDADRSFIRSRLGKLTKKESFNFIFLVPDA